MSCAPKPFVSDSDRNGKGRARGVGVGVGWGVGVRGDRKLHQYKLVAVICSLTVPPVPTTPSAERDTLV